MSRCPVLKAFCCCLYENLLQKQCLHIATSPVFQCIQFKAESYCRSCLPLSIDVRRIFPQSHVDKQSHLFSYLSSMNTLFGWVLSSSVSCFRYISIPLHHKMFKISHLRRNPVVPPNHSQGSPKQLRDRKHQKLTCIGKYFKITTIKGWTKNKKCKTRERGFNIT